jgi:hypothetical protein
MLARRRLDAPFVEEPLGWAASSGARIGDALVYAGEGRWEVSAVDGICFVPAGGRLSPSLDSPRHGWRPGLRHTTGVTVLCALQEVHPDPFLH